MQARASALNALIETGSLTLLSGEDPLEHELQELTASKAVEDELDALKAKLNAEGLATRAGDPQPMVT